MTSLSRLIAAALVVRSVAAQISFCAPSNNDVCFQIGIPATAQSANSGDMFFQMRAPTSYAWVGLGQGVGMINSNLFVMYQDGAGNVTVSPRSATAYVQPQYNPQGAQITLLAGSGVIGSNMVANVLCSNCNSWNGGTANFGGSSGFVSAWLSGTFSSSSLNAVITQHDNQDVFTQNLAGATISQDANPFLAPASSVPAAIPGGNLPPSPPASSNPYTPGPAPVPQPSSGTNVVVPSNIAQTLVIIHIHGIIMAIVFLTLYPIGSFVMPLLGKWVLHASWQMMAFIAMWAGFGLGFVAARDFGILFKQPHTIIGLTVCAMMAVQPLLGWLHHRHFVRFQTRGVFSYVHVYYGRGLMALGIVNGGLGLQLARASWGLITAYIIVAGLMCLFYLFAVLIRHFRLTHSRGKSVSPISSPIPLVASDGTKLFGHTGSRTHPDPAQYHADVSPPQSYHPGTEYYLNSASSSIQPSRNRGY